MIYNYRNEKFKIVKETNVRFKLYHIIVNKWSKGFTYIGNFTSHDAAQIAAQKYCS
jgi:hypothetical protein